MHRLLRIARIMWIARSARKTRSRWAYMPTCVFTLCVDLRYAWALIETLSSEHGASNRE